MRELRQRQFVLLTNLATTTAMFATSHMTLRRYEQMLAKLRRRITAHSVTHFPLWPRSVIELGDVWIKIKSFHPSKFTSRPPYRYLPAAQRVKMLPWMALHGSLGAWPAKLYISRSSSWCSRFAEARTHDLFAIVLRFAYTIHARIICVRRCCAHLRIC